MGKIYLCAFIFMVINPMFNKKNYGLYLGAILATLVFFSYHLIITPAMDLYRYVGLMELYNRMGLEWVLDNRMDSNPLADLFFWAFSYFENPLVLPAFSAFVCYGVAFYLIMKVSRRYNLEKKHMNLLLLFFCLNFYYDHAIMNIRIYLCYALYAFFMYNELIENRYKLASWVVYVACCFMHYAMLPLLGFRVLLLARNKFFKDNFVFYFVLIMVILGSNFLLRRFGSVSSLFVTLTDKLESYKDYDVFGRWQQLSSVLRMCAVLIFGMFFNQYYKYAEKEQKFVFYMNCIAIFLFMQINEYQLIYRTPNFFHYIGMVPLAMFLKDSDSSKTTKQVREKGLMKMMWIGVSMFTIVYMVAFIYPSIYFRF